MSRGRFVASSLVLAGSVQRLDRDEYTPRLESKCDPLPTD